MHRNGKAPSTGTLGTVKVPTKALKVQVGLPAVGKITVKAVEVRFCAAVRSAACCALPGT